jgi:hypothetical protein
MEKSMLFSNRKYFGASGYLLFFLVLGRCGGLFMRYG